jgi:hypothetical protein
MVQIKTGLSLWLDEKRASDQCNDDLLYRDPCACSSNYGDGKRLKCLDPQRLHRLPSFDPGQPIDYFRCAFEGGSRLGEVAGLPRLNEPAEHATPVR